MTQTPHDQPGQHYASRPTYPPQPYPSATHDAPTAPFWPFRPANGLAVAVAVLAGLVTLLELADRSTAWYSGEQLKDAATNGVAAWDVITPYDAMALPITGLLVAAWIVTALWLTQARNNANVLNPMMIHARSRVWAWLGWCVPVVSMWFPFQYVRDVRLATVTERRRFSGLVGWWWTMWLLYLVTSQIGTRIASGTEPNETLVVALGPVETVNAAAAVAALLLWLRIVQQITEDQKAVAQGGPTATAL